MSTSLQMTRNTLCSIPWGLLSLKSSYPDIPAHRKINKKAATHHCEHCTAFIPQNSRSCQPVSDVCLQSQKPSQTFNLSDNPSATPKARPLENQRKICKTQKCLKVSSPSCRFLVADRGVDGEPTEGGSWTTRTRMDDRT